MKVIFKSPKVLGNKYFSKGEQIIPKKLYKNLEFKKLVVSGDIQVLPKQQVKQVEIAPVQEEPKKEEKKKKA